MNDLISRQALCEYALNQKDKSVTPNDIMRFPSAQPVATDTNVGDIISRRQAIDAVKERYYKYGRFAKIEELVWSIEKLPSAQPEQRCVNCGRTANNGGWYEDGRTRCPIEEHYALPKDGYCHLWEKRKDWEDDYVKRPEEGEK